MLDAGAGHILQADVTRCGGITNLLRVDGLCSARNLPFSVHCAPAIESVLFDCALSPDRGLMVPHRSRPGLGLELKQFDVEHYAI
jgi:hypothetical protein